MRRAVGPNPLAGQQDMALRRLLGHARYMQRFHGEVRRRYTASHTSVAGALSFGDVREFSLNTMGHWRGHATPSRTTSGLRSCEPSGTGPCRSATKGDLVHHGGFVWPMLPLHIDPGRPPFGPKRTSIHPSLPGGGGGRVTQGRISGSQILCEVFLRNLFGVFKDLHGCMLGCAFAHSCHARGLGIRFPWNSQKC